MVITYEGWNRPVINEQDEGNADTPSSLPVITPVLTSIFYFYFTVILDLFFSRGCCPKCCTSEESFRDRGQPAGVLWGQKVILSFTFFVVLLRAATSVFIKRLSGVKMLL